MDQYRRRPPFGEGFLRDRRGGEFTDDDDSVEGHIMSPQRKATDDDEQDVEGHGPVFRKAAPEDEQDVEGHGPVFRKAAPDDDEDTEGHINLKR
jgi:hypothetical protein